ncbi:MAG: hypothetical protein ACI8PZ_004528 [Myxococcota bacterium]
MVACAAAPLPEAAVRETIDETTVGDLDGTPTPMGSMVQGNYPLPDGSTGTGWTATLALQAGPTVVGLGSEVSIDGATWRVVAIDKAPPEPGSVTLEPVAPSPE